MRWNAKIPPLEGVPRSRSGWHEVEWACSSPGMVCTTKDFLYDLVPNMISSMFWSPTKNFHYDLVLDKGFPL